jgi:hypothetical protein
MRRLISTRRVIPRDRAQLYLSAWQMLRDAVKTLGANAWIFRGAGDNGSYIEFIEWSSGNVEPMTTGAVKAADARIAEIATSSHRDEWEEAT